MGTITFFKEDITIDLKTLKKYKNWLIELASIHFYDINELNYIFCSDEYLHKINVEYLDHDTYTDIITFDMKDENESTSKVIEGDIFISIDRIKENTKKLGESFENELARVIAHGLLHLIGFKDKTDIDKSEMRAAEDRALELLK